MKTFGIKRLGSTAGFLTGLACAIVSSVAVAQPVPLQPLPAAPAGSQPAAQPVIVAPAESAVTGQPTTSAPPPVSGGIPAPPPASGGISVSALPIYDPSMHGTLSQATGGFAADMWSGSPRALIEDLLPRLPVATGSRTLAHLTRRLLLSAAQPPAGPGTGLSLLAARLERLAAAGELAAAEAVAERAGPAAYNESILHILSAAMLVRNELDGACRIAGEVVQTSTDPYWLKLSGFCRALTGDTNAALLSAGLAAEEDASDTAYQALLAMLTGSAEITLKSLPEPSLLHLAMMRATGKPIPDDVHTGASAAGLRLIAGMPNAALPLRIAAAEKAETLGALDSAALMQIYAGAPAPGANTDSESPAALNRAQLYQTVQSAGPQRPRALAAVWAAARANGTFGTAARATLGAAQSVEPAPELLWITGEMARALLAGGDVAGAARWYQATRASATSGSVEAQRAAAHLWPLMRLALPVEAMPYDAANLEAWIADLGRLPPEDRQQKGETMLTALAALGFDVPQQVWNQLALGSPLHLERDHSPSATLLRLLENAGRNGRVGEAVLLTVICLGEGPRGLENPVALGPALRALTLIGLPSETRALAIEAALAANL